HDSSHILHQLHLFFFSQPPTPPTSTLFPYTTLFRSRQRICRRHPAGRWRVHVHLRCVGRGLQDRRALRHARQDRLEDGPRPTKRSEEHTSELQSRRDLVCRLLLEKKK